MIVIVKIRKPNVPPNFSDFQSLLLYTSAILSLLQAKIRIISQNRSFSAPSIGNYAKYTKLQLKKNTPHL